ncbi:hypothetical protein F4803DRAFT_549259 [Xylaria telfairii]|nr:hypothetical protein F4803DRAFT_549259 [Xylaria telfairii]
MSLLALNYAYEAVANFTKPTLVYVTFWDGDSLAAHRPGPCPQYKFGGVPCRDIDCFIESYENIQTPQSIYTETGRIQSPCEIRDAEGKPIDYYFLENFHRTNVRNAREISRALQAPGSIHHGVDWWPHLVARLSEVWEVMGSWDLRIDSDDRRKLKTFKSFFGILASSSVALQDYLILIDHKENDERTIEDYDCFAKTGKPKHNQKLMEAIKSYDVTDKLPGNITFAFIKDFDENQRLWAKEVEKCIAAWNTVPGLSPPRAFFVRWKTDEERREEYYDPAIGAPTLEEQMRCQPVLGFTQRLNAYIMSSRR